MSRLIAFLILLFASCAVAAQGVPAQRHYEYLLYLKADAVRDPVAVARANLPTAMARHHPVTPAALRAWNGQGQIPLAVESRSLSGKVVDEIGISDTGEPLRKVLGLAPNKPATVLAIMIGIPPGRDIAAYAEALQASVNIAQALKAPAFEDRETLELLRIQGLVERLRSGQKGRQLPVSAANPPKFTIMGGFTALSRMEGGGVRTGGMRKAGLPDLVLGDWIPALTDTLVFDALVDRMLAGKIAPQPGSGFEIRIGEMDVEGGLDSYARAGASAPLRFASAANAPQLPGTLAIEFPGPPELDLYQRQILFAYALIGSPYRTLAPARARELSLAVARSQSQMRALYPRWRQLQKKGARVFVAARMDLAVKGEAVLWHELLNWESDGQMLWRRWKGDPRAGGVVERLDKPFTLDGQTHYFIDSDARAGDVEDILIIDQHGKASGGEVTKLLKGWR